MKAKLSFWARSVIVICMLVVGGSQAWAWSDFALRGDFNGPTWTAIYLETTVNENHFTGTIDASSWEDNKTYTFQFYNEENGGATKNYWGSETWNPDFTSTSTCTIDERYNTGNMTLKHSTAYSSYTVDAEYKDNSYWHVTITGVPSETKYTINIINGTGGTVSPSGNQQVGATGINVTATANAGYKFKNWTVEGGASVTSTTSATTLTATAAGSLKANFEKVTPLTIYLQNDGNWTIPITAYVYNENSDPAIKNANWPGVEMTPLGNGRFSYTITNEALFDGRVIFVGTGSRYPADGESGLAIENKSKVFNTSGNTWGLAGPTVTFTPASGSYTEAKNLQVTLSGEADTKNYTCIVTKGGSQVASVIYNMTTTTVTQPVYDATENGTYVVTVKDADDNVLATATYTIAIETKYAVEVSAGANGNVSPSGNINVGTTPVAISATANSGYQFSHWTTSGGVSVANAVSANTTITANSAGTVKAIFEEYTAPDMSYYLVGNFFDDDPADEIDYNRRYFKFNIQSNGKYMVEIPAAVTARAQIIGVTDQVYKFGPTEAIHNIKWDWPATDGSATGTFAEKGTTNYWNLTTRNDGTHDDDGLYEVWFTAGADGTPTDWEFKHVSTRRVAYFLSDAEGATANPVYDKRNNSTSNFSNKTYAMVYIDPAQKYYTIGYVLRDKESDYINKANNTVSGGYGAHVNNKNQDVLPTTNKLFLMGNNGRTFMAQNPYNEVSPHVDPIVVNKEKGLYKVEYNPSNGNNEWAKGTHSEQPDDEKNTVGIRGQIIFLGGDMGGTGEDSPISSISMVGNAIPGTTTGTTWNWTSTAGDMTYDENDGCYKLTIQTTASESKNNRFRFVANHNKAMTWYEDGTTDDKTARVPYASAGTGHSCLPTDPNAVSYTVSDNTDNTDLNIIFNRPAGTWTIRFYIDINEQGQKSYRYTITGQEDRDVTLTLVCNKYIRTYSNSVSMDMPVGMKAYEAYKFADAYSVQKIEDNGEISIYDNCRVYLRELKYIPANMGVVLVVDQVEQESEATKKFTLQTRSEKDFEDYRDVWVRGVEYKGKGEQWNNFLVPTVTANDTLGNASYDNNGNVTYRHFGLSNYRRTAYYNEKQEGEDYLGFFRLTANGRSGANKAYLSIPSSKAKDWTTGMQSLYGVLNYNAQLSGQETDEGTSTSLAKAMILFDDILFDEEDNIVTGVTSVNQNADNSNVYYNMQGVRVLAPTKGLYISNGKKIVIK